MSDRPGPPTLSLALRTVLEAAVDGGSRTGLLAVVHPADAEHALVVPLPAPRRPLDDGPLHDGPLDDGPSAA